MKVLHTIYNNTDIEFALNGENIMVNATQMAQAFNKRINHFLRSDHAQNYIKVLENFLQKGRTETKTRRTPKKTPRRLRRVSLH